jgi:hypothetical protein
MIGTNIDFSLPHTLFRTSPSPEQISPFSKQSDAELNFFGSAQAIEQSLFSPSHLSTNNIFGLPH